MTNVGTIMGTLAEFGTSAEVEIGGAKWSFYRVAHSTHVVFILRCIVDNGTNVLWNCTARGRLTAWYSIDEKKTVMWSHCFDWFNALNGYAYSQRICFSLPLSPVNFEAEVEVIKLHVVDLSAPPPSKSIESVEDSACFKVGGGRLRLSKKMLSFHSPFFEKMFSADFEEDAYVLEKVNMDEFKLFLSVLYNLRIPITTQENLEDLLYLGKMYQCDLVLSFCHDILANPEKKFLTLEAKIKLCDRHDFSPLITTIIEKADLDEVKQLVQSGCGLHLHHFTLNVIMSRLAASE